MRTLVLAGNHRQFEYWLWNNKFSPHDYKYIDRIDHIRGVDRNTPVILIGTYYNNKAYDATMCRFYNIKECSD